MVIDSSALFAVLRGEPEGAAFVTQDGDRKSTRLNSSHTVISYAVFCLEIKIPLSDAHPDDDPSYVRFIHFHICVLELAQFADAHNRGGVNELEAIQTRWFAEA